MAQTAFVIREPPQIHKDSSCNFERLFIKLFDEKEITRDLERVNTRNFNFSITAQGNQIAKARALSDGSTPLPFHSFQAYRGRLLLQNGAVYR